MELRSGNPDNPHSDNQSLDGGFSKKEIAVAQAYVRWTARDYLKITAGKFSPKKLWHVSDMQWDDDVIAEGLFEAFTWKPGNAVKQLDLNLYQFVLEESGSSSDAYMFGGQVAPTFQLNDTNQVTVGAGYDAISHPEKIAALTLGGKLATEPEETVTNLLDPETGEPVSDFRVANAFLVWKNKSIEGWPVKLMAFFYKNLGAESCQGSILRADDDDLVELASDLVGDENDTAFFTRLQVGDYKKPGQWAFRLAWYDSEPDAIFYPFVQSDTRRGTNVDGWRADVRVGMPASSHINFTWYRTDFKVDIDPDQSDAETMDRWQLDYIFKF
jgi:hypothetical protein